MAYSRPNYTQEYKIIYEKYIGECVPSDFEIHHIDCNHENNKPENMVALPKILHRGLHTYHYTIIFDPVYKKLGEARARLEEQEVEYWIIFRNCLHELQEAHH